MDILLAKLGTKIRFSHVKLLFLHIELFCQLLVKFMKLDWSDFVAKFPKTVNWAKNQFSAHLAKFGQNENFLKKWALLSFYPYCPQSSCQISENSLEQFRRSINSSSTDEQTDKGDIL